MLFSSIFTTAIRNTSLLLHFPWHLRCSIQHFPSRPSTPRLIHIMTSSAITPTRQEDYESAMIQLNTLVTNREIVMTQNLQEKHLRHIPNMQQYFQILGISDEALNRLNVIHVTGTKGKGSVCAFAESLLRHRGFKTGFYSSPHLIETRERIRLNGVPLSRDTFTRYFWPLYDSLVLGLPPDVEKPFYFAFLTVMAFHVFIQEQVDVAIIEVGMGGRYDNTTVVPNPIVCGISSLGFDHMQVLGRTIPEIAFNKAGIIRGDCIAVTLPEQPEGTFQALQEEAARQECPLFTVGERLMTTSPQQEDALRHWTDVQHWNASLALHLCHFWERRRHFSLHQRKEENKQLCAKFPPLHRLDVFPLDDDTVAALTSTQWPGRLQTIQTRNNVFFHLDGAHTPESLQKCAEWYRGILKPGIKKVLIFNLIGGRGMQLMKELMGIEFGLVIFSPNVAFRTRTNLGSMEGPAEMLRADTIKLCTAWREFRVEEGDKVMNEDVKTVTCVEEAVDMLQEWDGNPTGAPVQVLVAGSLHLVGAALHVLDPSCVDSTVTRTDSI